MGALRVQPVRSNSVAKVMALASHSEASSKCTATCETDVSTPSPRRRWRILWASCFWPLVNWSYLIVLPLTVASGASLVCVALFPRGVDDGAQLRATPPGGTPNGAMSPSTVPLRFGCADQRLSPHG